MTPDIAAPLAAAFLLIVVTAGVQAPTLVARLQRKPDRSSDALRRDAAADRIDLALAGNSEFGAHVAKANEAGAGFGKRCVDVAAALCLLTFLAPLLALTVLAIRLDSPGPALYRQRRVGAGGRIFEIYKFRSMRIDAEKDGARWASANDERVTRVGRVIRRTRIDEIPQAINVLRGEMSFVGPRPERPEFVALLEREIPNYHLRHSVKPGITGWAQVRYVYAASIEDARIKLQYDLFYVRHFALWRDLLIIFLTIKVALFGIGSR